MDKQTYLSEPDKALLKSLVTAEATNLREESRANCFEEIGKIYIELVSAFIEGEDRGECLQRMKNHMNGR